MEREGGGYDLAGRVIGLAMKVHSALGPGFLESVYENALAIELEEAGISFERQARISGQYRDRDVGDFICDFLVEGELIVELKSVLVMAPVHEVQVVNYLAATGKREGLLLNFGSQKLEFKKKFRQYHSVNSVHCFARSRSSHPSGCFPKQAASRVPTRRCSVKKASAFTMLELLVSMAVLSLLVVVLLSMVDNATKMWRQSENRVDAYREARAALNLMASDLASIYASTNTNFFYFDREPKPLPTVSTDLDGNLFFVTAIPTKAQGNDPSDVPEKSDLCTVGYFAGFDETSIIGDGKKSMNLYRYYRGSNETFEALKTGDIADNMAISADSRDTYSEVLAKNITGFKVAAYSKDPGTPGALKEFDQTKTPVPDVLEITLSAISNDAAKRFEDEDDWKNIDPVTRKQIERTFTKRVVLNRDASPPTPVP
jgi:GxxExxY protein